MSRRRVLTIVTAVLLTAAGTVILLIYVSGAERRALEGQDLVDTVVVTREIARGTPTTEMSDSVAVQGLPAAVRAEGALSSLSPLSEGTRVAAVDLEPGEQLLSSRLTTPEQVQGPGSARVEPEQQVVTISVDAQRAVGGQVRPGQLVGVIASFDQAEVPDEANPGETTLADASTGMVLQQIPVIGVSGGVAGEDEAAPAQAVLVSLAVDRPDAELLIFAAEHGRIWLTRQTDDTSTSGGRTRTLDNVFDRIESGS